MPNVTRPNNGGDKARVVITVPRRPSQFESALAEIPDSGVLIETHAAFLHLSRLARARLVLVAPFLDEAGARWAISMFEATPAPERVLLCRNVSAFDDLPMDCKQALEALGVQIRTYALIHEKDCRYVGRESFHAKIVLADQVAAYVGSVNLLQSSKEIMLECGVLLEGRPVRDVYDVVQTMLRLSTSRKSPET